MSVAVQIINANVSFELAACEYEPFDVNARYVWVHLRKRALISGLQAPRCLLGHRHEVGDSASHLQAAGHFEKCMHRHCAMLFYLLFLL
jgi:hypothetical protein